MSAKKQIEFCEHNLKGEQIVSASIQLQKLAAAKASFVQVRCIGDCRACHAGALIVRIDGQIIAAETSDEVIRQVLALL